MTNRALRLLLLAWVSCAAVSCGETDDRVEPDAGTQEPEAGSAEGSAGQSGSGSGPRPAGNRAIAGRGAAGDPAPIECGGMTCPAPSGPFAAFATACCDAASDSCGMSIAGTACTVPPASDPQCPPFNFAGFVSLPSCCASGGECGINASMFGQPSCVSLPEAARMAMRFGGGAFIPIPDPQPCDDGADAGADDAGI